MKIIRPYAKLMPLHFGHVPNELGASEFNKAQGCGKMQQIEWAARISHRAEESQTADSWKRFIQSVVLDHGDWSIVEHVSVTVDAVVDRGITHEWVRHRLFSFTQESTRFVNYEKKMLPSFIYPKPEVECFRCLRGDELAHNPEVGVFHTPFNSEGDRCPYDLDWVYSIEEVEKRYKKLLAKGWRPQEARSVFPNALASRIITTGNLRNWRHFFIMRTTAEAHPQMRQVTIPLLAEFKQAFPLLFDDIEPMSRQSESMKKMR